MAFDLETWPDALASLWSAYFSLTVRFISIGHGSSTLVIAAIS
jgi:hypothetical protein